MLGVLLGLTDSDLLAACFFLSRWDGALLVVFAILVRAFYYLSMRDAAFIYR